MESMKHEIDNKNLKNEIILLGAFTLFFICLGIFLILQREFDFWLLKPVGFFCIFSPLAFIFNYIRVQYQIELEKSQFLDRILFSNPAHILLFDMDRKNTYVLNGEIVNLDYSEEELNASRKNLFEILSSSQSELSKINSDLMQANQLDNDNGFIETEWKFLNKEKKEQIFNSRISKISFGKKSNFLICFIENITDRKNLESKLEKNKSHIIEMEKYAVLKNIGSGIAHEIANPLAAIKGKAQFLKYRIKESKLSNEQIIEGLEKIEKGADRINNTLNSLRQLTKENMNEKIYPHKITEIFHNIESVWAQKLRTHDFEFEINTENQELFLNCRKSQIETVLLNMISNSYEILKNNEIKWIKINASENVDQIIIKITDSGNGVSTALQEKIFDPFYTSSSKNSGMGLSIAKNLVESHDGTIELNKNNVNTQFIIKLPKNKISKAVS